MRQVADQLSVIIVLSQMHVYNRRTNTYNDKNGNYNDHINKDNEKDDNYIDI